jgi:hypothetical protein
VRERGSIGDTRLSIGQMEFQLELELWGTSPDRCRLAVMLGTGLCDHWMNATSLRPAVSRTWGLWGFQIDFYLFYLFIIGVRIFAYKIITTGINHERTSRVSVMKCKKEIGFGSPSDLVNKDDCGIIACQCILLFHLRFCGLHVAQMLRSLST